MFRIRYSKRNRNSSTHLKSDAGKMRMALRMIANTKWTTLAVKHKQLESLALNDVCCVEGNGDAVSRVVLRAGAGAGCGTSVSVGVGVGAGAGADIACCGGAKVSDDSLRVKGARRVIENFPRVEIQLLVIAETV